MFHKKKFCQKSLIKKRRNLVKIKSLFKKKMFAYLFLCWSGVASREPGKGLALGSKHKCLTHIKLYFDICSSKNLAKNPLGNLVKQTN